MDYRYLITNIEWNSNEESLPEVIVVALSDQWDINTEESVIEAIADEYLWEPISFTHESIDEFNEDEYCDLPEIIIK
jgi:hypothetical protein